MAQQHCADCLYFCRHYIPWSGNSYIPVEYGHCIYARTKMCRAGRAACKHFLPRTTPQDGGQP